MTALSGIVEAHGSGDEATQRAFCGFLKSEREFVKLYTAYPNSEITALLIAIAEESTNFLMKNHQEAMSLKDDTELLSDVQAMPEEERRQLLTQPNKVLQQRVQGQCVERLYQGLCRGMMYC